MQELFKTTILLVNFYKADQSDFRNDNDPETIVDTKTSLLINYSKSFAEHFPLVMKFLIDVDPFPTLVFRKRYLKYSRIDYSTKDLFYFHRAAIPFEFSD